MCFRFASCIGVHVRDDVDLHAPTPPPASKSVPAVPPRRATTKTPAPRDGYPYASNADEAGSMVRPSAAAAAPAVAATMGGGRGHGAGTPEQAHAYKAGDEEALKRPAAASNNKVDNGVGNSGHYPTAAATSDHER